jgi:hypothetical protein
MELRKRQHVENLIGRGFVPFVVYEKSKNSTGNQQSLQLEYCLTNEMIYEKSYCEFMQPPEELAYHFDCIYYPMVTIELLRSKIFYFFHLAELPLP